MSDQAITDISEIAIQRSVPAWIQDSYPQFVAFCEAYFDYLSLQGNPNDLIQNFLAYQDIDTTLDEFLIHFQKKYAPLIPKNTQADPRLFIKHLKKFYKGKGTEAGFSFLFRIIYNEDIEIYYPRQYILKASDGKWQQIISVKISQSNLSSIQDIFNVTLSGQQSFAKASVYAVLTYTNRDEPIYELILQDLRGTFQDGEQILIDGVPNTPNPIYVLEVVSGIDVTDGGYQYNIGDQVNIIDSSDSSLVGTGNVTSTSRGPVAGLSIIQGGANYNGEYKEVTDFAYLPIGWTLDGVYLPDAVIGGDSYNEDFSTETISHTIDLQNIPGTGDIISIQDQPIPIGTGANAIVSLVSQNGEILAVDLETTGANYESPIATVLSTTGSGAVIDVLGGGGRITSVQLNDFPVVERTDQYPNDDLTVDFSPSLTGSDALGTVKLNGGLIQYAGTWINDDGRLDTTMKLQDNKYYQDFSYVILSRINSATWQNVINKISHPAGFLNFGELKFKSICRMPLPKVAATSMTFTEANNIVTPDGYEIGLPDGGVLLTP